MYFTVHLLQLISMRRGRGALRLYSRVTCSDRLITGVLNKPEEIFEGHILVCFVFTFPQWFSCFRNNAIMKNGDI